MARGVARMLAVVLVLVVAGCGDQGEPAGRSTPRASPTPGATTADKCPNPHQRASRAPRGLLELDGAIIEQVDRGESLIVKGFMRRSPAAFLDLVNSSGYSVRFQETEGWESEALITDGRYRNFWTVWSVCPDGSEFAVVVIRERAAR